MPAGIGIPSGNLTGAPSGSAVQEVTTEETVELKTLRDFSGNTKLVDMLGFKTVTRTIRGYGMAATALATVTTGAINATPKVIEAKTTETNEDFPQFDITTKSYEDL